MIFATGDLFDVALLVLGGLLMGGALLSGLAQRSFLSLTALFVLAGFALGDGALGVLELDPGSGLVHDLTIVALVVILFRDGLEVEAELLQTAWHVPLRKLVPAMFGDGWAAVAVVAVTLLVARPVAIAIALIGSGVSADRTAFMAWFGPKGVATMTFALLVLADAIPAGERIFNLAALCVFVSILAHGLTDAPGAEWLARRDGQPAPAR